MQRTHAVQGVDIILLRYAYWFHAKVSEKGRRWAFVYRELFMTPQNSPLLLWNKESHHKSTLRLSLDNSQWNCKQITFANDVASVPRWSVMKNSRGNDTKGLFTWTRDSELPRGNDCPRASVNSRSHDDLLSQGNVVSGQLHCPGASSRSSDHYEIIWIPLVFTQIVTENEF